MNATRQEVQIASDIRLMAMSAVKVAGFDARTHRYRLRMDEIRKLCDAVIRDGPAEHLHILEDTASAAEVDHELRKRAYPESYR